MNVGIIGGAGFLGKNLARMLCRQNKCRVSVADTALSYWESMSIPEAETIPFFEQPFGINSNYKPFLSNQDVIFHLASTSFPAISNVNIREEIEENVIGSIRLLDACQECGVGKVIFFSSGGTVYGKSEPCPLSETAQTNPITAYGVQKLTTEKLLYLYSKIYGLKVKIVRLANPFGPYQRPNGKLGAATTFIYKALCGEEINVYGDGSVVRDYIYVEDALNAALKIAWDDSDMEHIYNIGSGRGTSLNALLKLIQSTLNIPLHVSYFPGRDVDVPANYLDISRYENRYGSLVTVSMEEGIRKTAQYLKENCIS